MINKRKEFFVWVQFFILMAVIFGALAMSNLGCALQNMKPTDAATTVGGLGSQGVLDLYSEYDRLMNDDTLSQEAKDQLFAKVAPVLDKMKYEQIKYNKMVIKWIESKPAEGTEPPAEIAQQKYLYLKQATEATGLISAILSTYGKKGEKK